MSDKGNDNDELNEEEETKDEHKDNSDLILSEINQNKLFEESSAKIYDIIYEIYTQNKDSFFAKNFNLYSPFLELFQPGINYEAEVANKKIIINNDIKVNLDDIKNQVINTYKKFKCKTYPLIKDQYSTYFGRDDLYVHGILYVSLQNKLSKYDQDDVCDERTLKSINGEDFVHGNVYFRISSLKKYKECTGQETRCRIAIHLNQSPLEFWNGPLLGELVNVLVRYNFVKALKVRDVYDFGRGDSLLIYCSIAATDAWKIMRKDIIDVLPPMVRGKYLMPFAKSLDLGINANIPIYYPVDDNLKKTSFTDGMAKIARRALKGLLNDKRFRMHGIYDVKMKTQKVRQANREIFRRYLAKEIQNCYLGVEEDGALYQKFEVVRST